MDASIPDKWWAEVFDRDYLDSFDSLYTSKRTKKEVDFILKNTKLSRGMEILDIPCGQGRHSIELAKRGFKVTGVDYSADFISVAKQRAKENGVSSIFIKQDMRFTKLHEQFDLVFTLGNSFGYFEDKDNERFISNVSSMMNKKGHFILDLANTAGLLRNIKCESKIKVPGGRIATENIGFDPVSFTLKLRWTIVRNNKKRYLLGKIRLYTFPEIKRILKSHGLSVMDIFGSFEGEEYMIETPRLIIIARKE